MEYYYNLATGQVEEGKRTAAVARMGPYPTRAAALAALTSARTRNNAWDEDDRAWKEWEEDDPR